MALLVISSNDSSGTFPLKKRPGLQLVDALRRFEVFSLLDVPSNFGLIWFGGRLKIMGLYLRAILELIRNRNQEIFFYNCPIAYVFLYLVALFCKRTRPSLLLADGINCVFMKFSPVLFLKFFRRVITLPNNEVIQSLSSERENYIWYPGYSSLKEGHPRESRVPNDIVRFLYNSSLLPNNKPECLLTLSRQYSWMEIIVTDTESNFKDYLSRTNIAVDVLIPENLHFVGVLPFSEYGKLIRAVDGVILSRDEELFANKYNFPSKLVEALQVDIAIVSLYAISNVPDILYSLINSGYDSEVRIRAHLGQLSQKEYRSKREEFLALCDVGRLHRWVSAYAGKARSVD